MELAEVRRRLASSQGPKFWRSLEELAGSEHLATWIREEHPRQADIWIEQLSRRKFLTLIGASLALAGLSGCHVQPPAETIMPYVKAPEQMVPGKPLFYATAMSHAGGVTGLLVESHEGRPTKVEGNPDHPASLGASDIYAQASMLELYDPDRSQTVVSPGRISGWDDAAEAIRTVVREQSAKRGAGLRILTGEVTSPTLADQLQTILKAYPEAKWHTYESGRGEGPRQGAELAFGQPLQPRYRFDQAEVIVSLDADFLAPPGNLRYVRDFAASRQVHQDVAGAKQAKMNRLYVAECTPSLTGVKADHHWLMRGAEVESFARALAAKLDPKMVSLAPTDKLPVEEKWLDALVRDLKSAGGNGSKSLVLAGERQSAAVHALANAMNQTLGAIGTTVIYSDPVTFRPPEPKTVAGPSAPKSLESSASMASLAELVHAMQRGSVEMLLILGVNAAYGAPADLDFAGQLSSVKLTVHWGLYDDETAALCHWHLPAAHDFESWSDAQTYDGTATIMQPLIAPLYDGKTIHEVLSLLIDPVPRTSHDIVRDYWRRQWNKHRASGAGSEPASSTIAASTSANQFEEFWETSLHDGVVRGTALPTKEPTLAADLTDKLRRDTPVRTANAKDTFEIVFQPDPTIFDGRWANNGWLQECPKPLTKLTWDNAVLVSINTAEALGLSVTPSGHGGEHGEVTVDMVQLDYAGRSITAAALILPGHPDNSATLTLGYGRTRAGQAGTGIGFNASRLRTSTAPWFDGGLKIRKTDDTFKLACTEAHHLMEDRGLIRAATLAEFHDEPTFAQHEPEPKAADAHQHEPKRADLEAALPSLYPKSDHEYNGYKWGMSIDLTKCVGCNACVIACQAENNIPVVGKDQVTRGREMHWIRVDRYYHYQVPPELGGQPEVHFQPIPCQQCENAPCEVVCPVAATVHSAEGLNDMVYNRCVGTRYCSNNCPYKVRRFNFLQFTDYTTPSLKLLNNPDVTVRSRGVMEKCTYCVQRITHARLDAEKQDRTVRDGEVLTACQAACPAEAIVFGDLNDPTSKVAQCKSLPTDYTILKDLNTRPRTTYLASLRNPNPEIVENPAY